MSSQQKRGFRLPWAAERAEDGATSATLEDADGQATTSDAPEDGVGGDLGEGPFRFADAATPDASTDATPGASEMPQSTEAAKMETESATVVDAAESAASEFDPAAWGVTEEIAHEAAIETSSAKPAATKATAQPASEARAVRSNPLVAGLVKAMREAATASREETTNQLQAEATARVATVREAGTTQAAELRKRADDDIASIRDWSKAEIARVRQETDQRIEARKTQLTEQVERHEASVERQVEAVQATIADYESEMDHFFERLLSENDPAKLAALAEQAPEAPDLSAELLAFGDEADEGTSEPSAEANAWDDVTWGGAQADADAAGNASDAPEGAAVPVFDDHTPLEADAAAEAEASATEGLDMSSGEDWPASVLATARRTAALVGNFEAAGVANTRLYVNGLTSVAGISSFKGALGQLPGIRSVSVSSGEPGVFIFTVVHSPETDLQEEVAGLTAFSATVTEASADSLTVLAEEPS